MEKKENRAYYFSVEGETEERYLKWLEKTINETPSRKYNAKFSIKVQNPLKRAKGISAIGKIEITHLCDVEETTEKYINRLKSTIDQMKQASKSGKSIRYELGYTNLTFELWMILHKKDFYTSLANREKYLDHINSAYGENFESLNKYKEEKGFQKILQKLTLQDVLDAIQRAEKIMEKNEENGHELKKYNGSEYYIHNPSLSIWKIIEKILSECGL